MRQRLDDGPGFFAAFEPKTGKSAFKVAPGS